MRYDQKSREIDQKVGTPKLRYVATIEPYAGAIKRYTDVQLHECQHLLNAVAGGEGDYEGT